MKEKRIIEFGDGQEIYGMIETNEPLSKITYFLEEYKKENEESYNMDDFISYLEKKKVKFKQIEITHRVHF